VRIQTRWRATTTATTTAKAKTLIRKNIDISDLLIQNAVAVGEDTKWQLIFSAVQSMNSN
jgi:hypothetical protein